jgi:hypothetical protein
MHELLAVSALSEMRVGGAPRGEPRLGTWGTGRRLHRRNQQQPRTWGWPRVPPGMGSAGGPNQGEVSFTPALNLSAGSTVYVGCVNGSYELTPASQADVQFLKVSLCSSRARAPTTS